jgi:hypothetical protein
MREKRVRVSSDELQLLKEYRDEEYPELPLGAVIRLMVTNDKQ